MSRTIRRRELGADSFVGAMAGHDIRSLHPWGAPADPLGFPSAPSRCCDIIRELILIAFDLDLGPMNIRPRIARSLGLVVFLAGSLLPCRAQVSENKPASVTQIQDEIKQHPGHSKLHVALGLAYWDHNDYPHAL